MTESALMSSTVHLVLLTVLFISVMAFVTRYRLKQKKKNIDTTKTDSIRKDLELDKAEPKELNSDKPKKESVEDPK